MADKLDAIGAVHAREKVAYEQQTAASLGNYKQKYAVYEQVFEELVNANNAKSTANWRNALGHISERKKMITSITFYFILSNFKWVCTESLLLLKFRMLLVFLSNPKCSCRNEHRRQTR